MNISEISDTEILTALKAIAAARKADWMQWFEKLEAVAKACGASSTDAGFDPSCEDLIAGGYTKSEAAALMYVMTEDDCGVVCDNCDTIDRWFASNF